MKEGETIVVRRVKNGWVFSLTSIQLRPDVGQTHVAETQDSLLQQLLELTRPTPASDNG